MPNMKAVRFHSFGGPEVLVLEEVPRPEAAAGEVLIRVQAAGINPLDWKVRAGRLQQWLPLRLPVIPGWDVSGIVEEVGTYVTRFKAGDAVYGMLDFRRNGAYADYVTAPYRDLAPKPESIDHIHAAAVPLAALTAWQALFDLGRLAAGQTVLIHAAAGGVGHFAVQLAKWKGARVIGTASAGSHGILRELGADEVIDYRTARFEDEVAEVDLVLDSVGGETQARSWQVLKDGGILVGTLGINSPQTARDRGVSGVGVSVRADNAQLVELKDLIDGGRVKPLIHTVLPLAKAAQAHELSETGHVRGKIVLQVG